MFAVLDELKNMKSSVKNDYATYRRYVAIDLKFLCLLKGIDEMKCILHLQYKTNSYNSIYIILNEPYTECLIL